MRLVKNDPPRRFRVGTAQEIELSDCGAIHLAPDELVTFVTPAGRRHDFAAKSWGFYATPSINARLSSQGFKTALVRNSQGRYYIMVVEPEGRVAFAEYLRRERNEVIEWLDEREARP